MKAKEIKTKVQIGDKIITDEFELSGWIHGKRSYLWFGSSGSCFATYGGRPLYLLCKKIVESYESDKSGNVR